MTLRAISHSEVDALLSCQAKHAFAYTGHLTDGTTLVPRSSAPLLRDGRAWGSAVASYHAEGHGTTALYRSLEADADEQRDAGTYDESHFAETLNRLTWMLEHYVRVDPQRIALIEREREILIPIRSRTGRQRSTRYRLHAFLDGVHVDADGRVWIVEFKLRGRLQSLELITLSRQIRWYAWAWRELTGNEPAGVVVDERLNELPAAVRLNQNGSISAVQSCTLDTYLWNCESLGQEPNENTVEQLRSKVWQQRHWILLSSPELDEAGWQLASAAQQVRRLDSMELYPIRNPTPTRCPSCAFKAICPDPTGDLVDAMFRRETPKRSRSWIGQTPEPQDQLEIAA